jgi:hypothetical protein
MYKSLKIQYVPQQLQRPEFRFVRLGRRGTEQGHRPIDKDWVQQNNSQHNNIRTMLHIENNNNVGIIGGHGNLMVIDFDRQEYQDIISPLLPETFTVSSGGKNLYHLYYIVDKPFNKFPIKKLVYDTEIDAMKEVTCADIICNGGYVLAPFSQHRKGGYYTVVKDIPISNITQCDLMGVLGDDFKLSRDPLPFIPNPSKSGNSIEEIKRNIPLSSVLSRYGVSKVYGNSRCACPRHPPSPGNLYNLSFHDSERYFKCFDSDEGGSVIDLVMHLECCGLAEAIGILEKW